MPDDKKVEHIGLPNTYTPEVMLSNLMESSDDIEFITMGICWKNGTATTGWTSHVDAFPLTAYLTDMLKEKNLQRTREAFLESFEDE